jgi:hypothetical protein
MAETPPPLKLRPPRIGRLVLCVVAVALFVFPPSASAVILMVVIDPLTLFEIEGITFFAYATSNRARLDIHDTDADLSGIVNVLGQREWSPQLTLVAVSRVDCNQKVRIEIDVSPLRGRGQETFFVLDALGVAVEPGAVTDPLLSALEGPLRLGFVLETPTRHPVPTHRRAVFRLRSVERGER